MNVSLSISTAGTLAVIVAVAAFSNPPKSAPEPEMTASSVAVSLKQQDEPIWSTRPVRIDRARQTYERVRVTSDPFPFKLAVSAKVVVEDSGSFSIDGSHFLLAGVVPIPAKEICTDALKRRLACGARGKAALRALLRKNALDCRRQPLARTVVLVSCQSRGTSVADLLLSSGAVRVPGR